jgi:hypothetical protein
MTALPRASGKNVAFAVVALALGACSISPFGGDCTDELRIHLAPRDTSVVVGASFDARVSLSTCGGSKRVSDTFTWTSLDPGVVQVTAATGRVTAVAVGEATVEVVGARSGPVGSIRIIVTSR